MAEILAFKPKNTAAPAWVITLLVDAHNEYRVWKINDLHRKRKITLAEANALHDYFLTQWDEATRWGA